MDASPGAGTTPPVIDLDVQLDGALDGLFHDLGDAAAFAEVAESVGKLPKDVRLPEAESLVRFLWRPHAKESMMAPVEVVGGNFASYSAQYAVLGMVTATEVYVSRLAFLSRLVRDLHESGGTITGQQFSALATEQRGKARHTSMASLIEKALKDVRANPTDVRHRLDHILGIYRLRVCLAHRGGIVGLEDAKEGLLEASWLKVVPEVDGLPVSEFPALVPAGATLSMPIRSEAKAWAVGEPIELTAKDCHNIACTLAIACTHFRDVVREKAVVMLGPPNPRAQGP